MSQTDTAPAVKPVEEWDDLDRELVGSWAGPGATQVVFEGRNQLHLVYPPGPNRRRYEVDPISGLITRPFA